MTDVLLLNYILGIDIFQRVFSSDSPVQRSRLLDTKLSDMQAVARMELTGCI